MLLINLFNSNTIHVYDLNNVQNVKSDTHNLGSLTNIHRLAGTITHFTQCIVILGSAKETKTIFHLK